MRAIAVRSIRGNHHREFSARLSVSGVRARVRARFIDVGGGGGERPRRRLHATAARAGSRLAPRVTDATPALAP